MAMGVPTMAIVHPMGAQMISKSFMCALRTDDELLAGYSVPMYIPAKTDTCCKGKSACPFSRGRYTCHEKCWCTKDATAVVLNGSWRMVEGKKRLYYADVLELLTNPRDELHTIRYSFSEQYRKGNEWYPSGRLLPGGPGVEVKHGLILTAIIEP